MAFKLVMIDPGHGGADPGAVNADLGMRESLLVLGYAAMIHAELMAQGWNADLTRASDQTVSLRERVEIARAAKADLFLSIHANSAENPEASGFEVWTSVGNTRADRYATSIFNEIAEEFPKLKRRVDLNDGDPDRERDYFVLKKTPMPAVLIEVGFICNKDEALWLASDKTIRRYSTAIARGVMKAGEKNG